MDQIKPLERNAFVGALADVLARAKQKTGVAGDVLLGGIPQALDDWSYGQRMTTGSGWTTQMKPGTAELAMAATPMKVGTAAPKALRVAELAAELQKLTGKQSLQALRAADAGVEVRNAMRKAGNLSGEAETFAETGRVAEIAQLLDGLTQRRSNHLYHTTGADRLESIRTQGLLQNAQKRHDISQPGVYMSASQQGARYFAPDATSPLLRTRRDYRPKAMENDLLGGDGSYRVLEDIPPEMLEYLANGRWKPLR